MAAAARRRRTVCGGSAAGRGVRETRNLSGSRAGVAAAAAMQEIIASVDHIKFDLEIAVEQQLGAQPLPFPGMDSERRVREEGEGAMDLAPGPPHTTPARCSSRTPCPSVRELLPLGPGTAFPKSWDPHPTFSRHLD